MTRAAENLGTISSFAVAINIVDSNRSDNNNNNSNSRNKDWQRP